MIEIGKPTHYYYKWATLKCRPQPVIPRRYVGIKGWEGWVDRRIIDGKRYAAEIWECEMENGMYENCVFRIPFEDVGDRPPHVTHDMLLPDYANSHFDGLEAYFSGEISRRNRTNLNREKKKLDIRKEALNRYFDELNNLENPELKLGVQLYLRRLETPTIQTAKDWKNYSFEHPYLKEQIINHVKTNNHDSIELSSDGGSITSTTEAS